MKSIATHIILALHNQYNVKDLLNVW